MGECDVCEKKIDLPFECAFCGGHFCLAHRLAENHSCPDAPSRTPLGYWKDKYIVPEVVGIPEVKGSDIQRILGCPKCESKRLQATAYRSDYTHYLCLDCNHKWKISKNAHQ
jgi:hypothetical protein